MTVSQSKCHFIHISSITQNYGHLKSIRPIAGKSKVVGPRSRCNVCVLHPHCTILFPDLITAADEASEGVTH